MDLDFLTRRPIAHRGLHDAAAGRIENTLSAAIAAAERGFAIECDVQLTADGEAVVFHDETLDRLTTATGRVDAMTSAALAEVPFKATADRIPTLRQFLDTIAGRVPLIVEIKSEFPDTADDRLTQRTLEVIAGYAGPIACMSFDPNVLMALQRLAPDVVRGIVADDAVSPNHYGNLDDAARMGLRHLLHIPRTKPHFVSYWVKRLPNTATTWANKTLGLPLICWTVRDHEDRRIAAEHADQITFEGFDPDA